MGTNQLYESIDIGWGANSRTIRIPTGAQILERPNLSMPELTEDRILDALRRPIGSSSLIEQLREVQNVCVLVPDETRKDASTTILPILSPLLNGLNVSWGIAAGKHPYIAPPAGYWRHDAHGPDLLAVGHTEAGTRVEFPREVVDADLCLLIGEIRPHYFAGYAGGAKTLFPGVAGARGIWHNHELKALPGASLGSVDHNPCRYDMEAAARMAGNAFIINIIRNRAGVPIDIVAGDIVEAHREGVAKARAHFEVHVRDRASVVLVSDGLPVTMNLYQACKLLPVAGRVLADNGTIVMCAECGDGLGPIDIINQQIYRLGCIPVLPRKHRIILVSSQNRQDVSATFADFEPSVESALEGLDHSNIIAIPFAGDVIPVNPQ